MVEIEVAVPDVSSTAEIERVIEDAQLFISLRGTLRSYPGCQHWHLKKPGQAGTLELTWWSDRGRLWFKISTNRRGDWMEEAIGTIRKQIEAGEC